MKNKLVLIFLLSVLICAVVSLLGLMLGAINFTPWDLIKIIKNEDGTGASILLYSRVPRVLASFLAGAALAVSGAVLQTVLSNDLASPSIVGVNAGAGLGVTLASALGIMSGFALSLFAFIGSIISVTLITVFSSRSGATRTTLILIGVALNSILGAISESIAVLDPDIAMLTTEFRVGGFSSVSYQKLLPAAVMIVVALLIIFILSNELDVLSLGEETAQSVGLASKRYRGIFLVLAAMLAGAAVSFCGLLGFIGLIVPHFVRRLVGNKSRRLLSLSALVGGAFVCLCDIVARTAFLPYELPVGIFMAVVGAPAFVFILVKKRGGWGDA